jgi:hypothetical protein
MDHPPRWLAWIVLALLAAGGLCGCAQRESANPFIGPYGASFNQPFG